MFDIGWSEMAVVVVIALLILGPKQLPQALKTVTSLTRQARRYAQEFRHGIDGIVRDAELQDARDALKTVRSANPSKVIQDLVDPTGDLNEDLQDLERTTKTEVKAGRDSLAKAGEAEAEEVSMLDPTSEAARKDKEQRAKTATASPDPNQDDPAKKAGTGAEPLDVTPTMPPVTPEKAAAPAQSLRPMPASAVTPAKTEPEAEPAAKAPTKKTRARKITTAKKTSAKTTTAKAPAKTATTRKAPAKAPAKASTSKTSTAQTSATKSSATKSKTTAKAPAKSTRTAKAPAAKPAAAEKPATETSEEAATPPASNAEGRREA
ncbi:MAG: Sec-independent protein translocase protein TatB [Pseudomonadota bacterium]